MIHVQGYPVFLKLMSLILVVGSYVEARITLWRHFIYKKEVFGHMVKSNNNKIGE